jgi:hypothetical protein
MDIAVYLSCFALFQVVYLLKFVFELAIKCDFDESNMEQTDYRKFNYIRNSFVITSMFAFITFGINL